MSAEEEQVSGSPLSDCSCRHCGLEFEPRNAEDAFCCSGCEYVYRLIRNEDFDRYYDLRGTKGQPVSSSVFLKRSWRWLEELLIGAEASEAQRCELKFSLGGISCVGCVWLIDKLFQEFEGGVTCSIDVQRGALNLVWKRGAFDVISFADRLRKFGYELGPFVGERRSETRELSWRIALCGALAMNAMLFTLPQYLGMESSFQFAPHFNWLSAVCASGSMLFGGWHFIGKALGGLRKKMVHMDLPISIGLVVSYLVSWYGFGRGIGDLVYFDFVSTFVFLMLVGRWIHVYAIERNRSRLSDIEITPPRVERLSGDGEGELVAVENLAIGDRYTISPGEWVPVMSRLCAFKACMGMDWINGESDARIFARGASLISGAVNRGSDRIELVARERWEESLMCRLLAARRSDETRDRVTGLWIARYLVSVVGISLIAFFAWSMAGEFDFALRVFVSALVVSCPCALGVALPMADELAQSSLKQCGVFVKTNTIWSRLSNIAQVVFDKTGTLTRSNLEWLNVDILKRLDAEQFEALSRLVSMSEHPVSSTVRESLFAKGLFVESEDWKIVEVVGDGVEACKGGVVWRLGRSEWAGTGVETGTVLSRNRVVNACLEFQDTAWPDASRELDELKVQGKQVRILSGDSQSKVDRIATSLGLTRGQALGNLLPQDKEKWIFENGGEVSMMVGDGANDSLAFDAASVTGTPVVGKSALTGKADFYYMGAGISGVRQLLEMGRKRMKAVRALVGFAVAYNVVALSFALLGLVTPLLAAVIMPISSLASLGIVWGLLGRRVNHIKQIKSNL